MTKAVTILAACFSVLSLNSCSVTGPLVGATGFGLTFYDVIDHHELFSKSSKASSDTLKPPIDDELKPLASLNPEFGFDCTKKNF